MVLNSLLLTTISLPRDSGTYKLFSRHHFLYVLAGKELAGNGLMAFDFGLQRSGQNGHRLDFRLAPK